MGVTVEPSALGELFVALSALSLDDKAIANNPWSHGVAERRPKLVQAVQQLWPEGTMLTRTGMELIVMGGTLGYLGDSTADRFLSDLPRLPHLLTATSGAYKPPGKVPDMEALLVDRFLELTEPTRMAHYAALVEQVWEEVRSVWEEGLTKIQGECAHFRQRVTEGTHWLNLLHRQHPARLDVFSDVMPTWPEVVIAPSLLARGMHFIDLRGRMFVGYAMHYQSLLEQSSHRSKEIAMQMKAFADPTRLALLFHISRIPASVSDLAKLLEISQPTASEHLKLLRQVGLVQVHRIGTKAYYYSDASAIQKVLEACRDHLTRTR